MNIQLIHGPNLNLLGVREPEVYGYDTLEDINASIVAEAEKFDVTVRAFQSNGEGALIDTIHEARTWASIALRDAIAGVEVPTIEVHLSNVHAREEFRHHSYLSPVTIGQVIGFGAQGYIMALHGAIAKGKKA